MSKLRQVLLPGLPGPLDAYKPSEFRRTALNICPHNYARAIVLEAFLEKISSIPLLEMASWRIGVVGGGKDDPECKFIQSQGLKITSIGIEESDIQLDLNDSPPEEIGKGFDLVLCSQVLEHLWNHENFFDNISCLLADGGYAWVAAPMANRFHSSPEYFSAGFSMGYLAKNLHSHGFEILDAGQIGSRRLFEATLTTDTWLSFRGNLCPAVFGFQEYPLRSRWLRRVRSLLKMIALQFSSGKIRHDSRYAVESWVWSRKI